MSRNLFSVDEGYELTAKDATPGSGQSQLRGSAAPGGDAGFQDAANPGSIYQRDNGEIYIKHTAGTGTDKWRRLADTADINQLTFRKECVRASTGEVLAAGVRNLTTTPFTDDEGTTLVATDFTQGEYVISDVNGTPKLFEVTNVSSPNITLTEETTNPLATGDNFVSKNHLPDTPDDQEVEALLHYTGAIVIKLGDTNWEFATGINLSSGYTPANGNITSSDTVESAIEKLDDNQADIQTALGIAQGATDLGTFPGDCIADNETVKGALEDLEACIEALGTTGLSQAAGVTTEVTLDSVVVDDVLASEWEVHMVEDANPTRVQVRKLFVTHDGHSGADAANLDDSVHTKLKLGADFNAVLIVDLNGVGAAQVMRLRVSSSTAGVTFTARRTDITAP